jgi:hypothetical protein
MRRGGWAKELNQTAATTCGGRSSAADFCDAFMPPSSWRFHWQIPEPRLCRRQIFSFHLIMYGARKKFPKERWQRRAHSPCTDGPFDIAHSMQTFRHRVWHIRKSD